MRSTLALALFALLAAGAPPAAAQTAAAPSTPATRAKAPQSVLDAPAYFGFDVVEARRGVDGKGWPTSTTLLKATLDDVFQRLSKLFANNKEFAPGWTIVGAGKSDQHRFVSATIQDPTGQRFTCETRQREEGVVQVELTARAYKSGGGPMLPPPAPDRTPPAAPVKP